MRCLKICVSLNAFSGCMKNAPCLKAIYIYSNIYFLIYQIIFLQLLHLCHDLVFQSLIMSMSDFFVQMVASLTVIVQRPSTFSLFIKLRLLSSLQRGPCFHKAVASDYPLLIRNQNLNNHSLLRLLKGVQVIC